MTTFLDLDSFSSRTDMLYQPYRLHPQLFTGEFDPSWVHDDLKAVTKALTSDDEEKKSEELPKELQVELPDRVYSFRCFTDEFLRLFKEEIANFYAMSEKHNIPVMRPNSMNNYGVIVNEIGMRSMITAFQQQYIQPLARYLFPVHGSSLDDHHAFIVRYQQDEDLGLDMHTDDSEITCNICLGENFKGASLTFCGMIGSSDHRLRSLTYHHEVGRAIIHLGSQRHGAEDISEGARFNLIIWSHNLEYRRNKGRGHGFEPEAAQPDEVCLSYTHDRDFKAYKPFPERAKKLHLHPWCPPPGMEYPGYPKVSRKDF